MPFEKKDGTELQKPECKVFSFLRRLKNLVGAGLHLLLAALSFEAITIGARQVISFPISLSAEMQIVLSLLCVFLCLTGIVWFNSSLNLIKIHMMGEENTLITQGPFIYVGHPLYATLGITLPPLMIIWYADLLFIVPWGVMLVVAHYVVLMEERGRIKAFGEDYKRYRMYVPALLPYKGAGGRRYLKHSARDSSENSDDGTAERVNRMLDQQQVKE